MRRAARRWRPIRTCSMLRRNGALARCRRPPGTGGLYGSEVSPAETGRKYAALKDTPRPPRRFTSVTVSSRDAGMTEPDSPAWIQLRADLMRSFPQFYELEPSG